jgi:quercetin dioxygenase-like cupin family protein
MQACVACMGSTRSVIVPHHPLRGPTVNDFLTIENRHTGEILRMRRVRDAAGEVVLTIEGTLPPGKSGPPPHVHYQQREEGTVIAGTLGARVGGKEVVLPAGSSAVFPAGVVHNWWNAGEDLLQFNGRAVPACDLDRFIQAVIAVLNASETGKPNLFYLAHVMSRHRQTQATMLPPLPIQRVLFPVVLLLGRALGKYRGTSWPGSPESCTGAPEVRADAAAS